MSEHFDDGICCKPEDLRRALAIHTQKITDSCRDKDCIEDLRVYLTKDSQTILEQAASAKVRSADLLHVSVQVSPMGFHPNRYCVDLTFYYRILADAMQNGCHPTPLCGLALFSKRAVLCGESAATHIFTSDSCAPLFPDRQLPRAVVEVLEPMVLASRLGCGCGQEPCPQCPKAVLDCFEDELCFCPCEKHLYVTLGQFSVIRLERPAQLIVPVLDYALPTKQCCENPGCTENPCELFAQIPFPAEDFAPTACDCPPKAEGCDCEHT